MGAVLDDAAVRGLLADHEGRDPGPLTLRRLGGGASRELYLVLAREGSERRWVLRRDPPGAESFVPLEVEFELLAQASAAGVPVSRPVAFEPAGGRLGSAAMLTSYVGGETIPPRILRREELARGREALPGQLALALARIHSIPPAGVKGLPGPIDPDPAIAACELWESQLDEIGEPLPGLEAGLRWLRLNAPEPPPRRTLVHGDFRLGNFIVDRSGLRAVLDWELCHAGDPAEDLSWLSIRSWRFGNDEHEVAGLIGIERFLDAYEAAGCERPDRERLRWWSVMSNLKWGVICARQAADHRRGLRRSHELAALGRRICEPEWDMLEEIAA